MRDYYEILEVSRKASQDTITKVFKIHMKANHPDLFQGEEKSKAEDKSKMLTEAYNVLSDKSQREKYDQELKEEENLNKNNEQYDNLLEENEYLRQIIENKDIIIAKLTNQPFYSNEYSNGYNNQYVNNGGFNGFTPPQQQRNPYEGYSLEQLQQLKKDQQKAYYKAIFKDVGIKLLILGILLIVLLISVAQSFKDLQLFFK